MILNGRRLPFLRAYWSISRKIPSSTGERRKISLPNLVHFVLIRLELVPLSESVWQPYTEILWTWGGCWLCWAQAEGGQRDKSLWDGEQGRSESNAGKAAVVDPRRLFGWAPRLSGVSRTCHEEYRARSAAGHGSPSLNFLTSYTCYCLKKWMENKVGIHKFL